MEEDQVKVEEQKKLQEAEQLLKQVEAKKQQECSKEIQEVLKKYNYTLEVTPARIIFVKAKEG